MIYTTAPYLYNAILSCLLFSHCLLCMDGTLKNDGTIVLETMLQHAPPFKHTSVCSLALVNKSCNQFIKKTAPIRQQYLENHYFCPANNKHWHIHGSAYAYLNYNGHRKKLRIHYIYLKNKKMITEAYAKWYNNPTLLPNEPKIFFNQKGDACFHITGMIDALGYGQCRNIIECSLGIDGTKKTVRCVVGIENDKQLVYTNLINFYSYQILLARILNSRHIYELSSPWHKDTIKVFRIEGIPLNNDYQDWPLKSHLTREKIKISHVIIDALVERCTGQKK